MANDMELGIETKIEGDILERGIIALDAKMFSNIVRSLPDNDVTIETNASFQTTITCEKTNFNIVGKSGDDFSYLPYIEKNDAIVISQFTLKEVIRQTIFSIADNDNNKLMTGELFEINENRLKVVSLDGHRISIRNIELKNNYNYKKVVVPGKTLQEISKIIPGGVDEDVLIYITENHVVFDFETTTVVSRLIEGEYFKIDQMLSSDYETKVKVNKRDLLDSINRATLMVNEGDKKPIIMNITDTNMELKINSFAGSMKEDVDIEKDGKDILIGFNPKFFIDALRVIDEEEVSLYMVNPKAPCFIKADDGSYTYLILPVNFNTAAN
jgi:DNA polymerase-3 subunit beta